jgi:hypothetical protein
MSNIEKNDQHFFLMHELITEVPYLTVFSIWKPVSEYMAGFKTNIKLTALILDKMENVEAARAYNTAKTLSFVATRSLLHLQ